MHVKKKKKEISSFCVFPSLISGKKKREQIWCFIEHSYDEKRKKEESTQPQTNGVVKMAAKLMERKKANTFATVLCKQKKGKNEEGHKCIHSYDIS